MRDSFLELLVALTVVALLAMAVWMPREGQCTFEVAEDGTVRLTIEQLRTCRENGQAELVVPPSWGQGDTVRILVGEPAVDGER